MSLYHYRALDEGGKVTRGVLEAEDERTLYQVLKERGLILIKASLERRFFRKGKKVQKKSLAEFSRHMNYIVRSGIPVVQGMLDIRDSTKDAAFRDVLEMVIKEVQAGQSLSSAMARHPHVFSKFYVAVVSAGETSGKLDQIFHDLANYLEWMMNLRSKVKQAFTYPIIVLCLISIALTIFVTYVIPKLVRFIMELNRPLPLFTKILVYFNQFIIQYWYILVVIALFIVISIMASGYSARMRLFWDRFKLRLPYLGSLFANLILTRFLHYLEMLYRAGIQIYQVLTLMKEVVNNKYFEQKVEQLRGLVLEGESLSNAVKRIGVFPPLFQRAISVGETTGTLDEVLKELGAQYEEEIDRSLKKLVSLIEPVLLIFVSAILILIIISVLWPIYTMLGEIK
ncbi:MAG: type II secretion system F family protein [Deltaproteobacteria bacterium]|nr:type II secretion system F family protein [Deltaproteobacteria bacterium]